MNASIPNECIFAFDIPKNALETVRVSLKEYLSRRFIDIRIVVGDDSGKFTVNTRKGITIPPDLVSEIIIALQSIQQEIDTESEK